MSSEGTGATSGAGDAGKGDRRMARAVTRRKSSFMRAADFVKGYFKEENKAQRTVQLALAKNVALFVGTIVLFQKYGHKLAV